jgi:hypothetical protein
LSGYADQPWPFDQLLADNGCSRLAPHRHGSDIDGLDLRQMGAGNQKRRWILPDTIIFAKPAAP